MISYKKFKVKLSFRNRTITYSCIVDALGRNGERWAFAGCAFLKLIQCGGFLAIADACFGNLIHFYLDIISRFLDRCIMTTLIIFVQVLPVMENLPCAIKKNGDFKFHIHLNNSYKSYNTA